MDKIVIVEKATGNITVVEDYLSKRNDDPLLFNIYTVAVIPPIDYKTQKYTFDATTLQLTVAALPVPTTDQTLKNIINNPTPTQQDLLTAISILSSKLGLK